MSLMNEKLDFYNSLVDKKMHEYLSSAEIPEKMREAMSYSVFAGGKRIRPALVLASYELFDDRIEKALPFACAIEFIHTYSLIHDDLPALDNDDYRRGRPTNHKVYGEDLAILAGDALLSYAFEIMLNASEDNESLEAAKYISYAAGAKKMVAGQWIDVSSNGKKITPETMEYIHLNKTAAMIIGAIKAGAACGGANENDIKRMEEYGREIGYTFQIIDDILDVEGNAEELGKKIGSDVANQKTTYVTLYCIQGAKEEAIKHTQNAISKISHYGEKADFFIELAQFLLNRKK